MITIDVEEQLDAFEAALGRGESAAALLPSFLPVVGAADYFPTLVELLRIALEHEFGQGQSSSIERYRSDFPLLFTQPDSLEPLAFEEYRLRCGAGESCDKHEFERRYGIDVADWPELTPASLKSAVRNSDGNDYWAEFSHSEPVSALGAIAARRTLPRVGEAFGSFQLIALLGEGAFGRVFLARQQALAGRLVALKITSGPTTEAQKLARLQHGNIMPVYSVHRRGKLSGICMPFLGSATLADVIRGFPQAGPKSAESLIKTLELRRAMLSTLQDGKSAGEKSDAGEIGLLQPESPKVTAGHALRADSLEVQVVRIMLQVADGLVQAHDRGILHRDIKPANILIADDGQPLLLDFNLAVEQSAHAARIGGTLPYMSPEQLAQFQESKTPLDGRSDIYSLGCVMYEFITAQQPFPLRRGEISRVIQEMRADRAITPANVQQVNRSISPGLAAIIECCLQPEPRQRYQRAEELRADLKLHAEHRPLRHARNPSISELATKWSRRHPRLTSISTVLLVVACLVMAAGAVWYSREEKLADQMASEVFRSAEEDFLKARSLLLVGGRGSDTARAGNQAAVAGLERYQVLTNSQWTSSRQVRRLSAEQQRQLGRDVSEVLLLVARSGGDDTQSSAPEVPDAQNLETIARASWKALVSSQPKQDSLDADSQAILELAEGVGDKSWPELEAKLKDLAVRRPRDAFAWLALSHFYRLQAKLPAAEAAATAAVALRPDLKLAWQLRGMVYLAQRRWQDAADDFSRAIDLHGDSKNSDHHTAYFNRGIAHQEQGEHPAAIADFTAALDQGFRETRVYFSRAKSHRALGDLEQSAADFKRGQELEPRDALSYVARALSYLPDDAVAAERDLELAQRLDPSSRLVLMNLAHVQAEHLQKTAEAIEVLAQIERLSPGDTDAIGSRAVLFARLQKREEAVAELKKLLQVNVRPPLAIYQSACVYALLSKDQPALRNQALQLLATSLATQPSLAKTARDDADLANLRDEPLFAQLTQGPKKNKQPE